MRVTEEDWDVIRKRLKIGKEPQLHPAWLSESHRQSLAMASRIRFQDNKDNPLVQGLKRFIMSNANAPLDDVLSWMIEFTEGDEKAFVVLLKDGRRYIGTLQPSYIIEGRWVCSEFKPELK